MSDSEKKLINMTCCLWSESFGLLFRNNTGVAWSGSSPRFKKGGIAKKIAQILGIKVNAGDTVAVLRNPRKIEFGLKKGSSDTIGVTKIKVTEEMVGRTLGVFTALEMKTGRTPTTEEQKNFISAVRESGGIAGIVYTVEEAVQLRENYLQCIRETGPKE